MKSPQLYTSYLYFLLACTRSACSVHALSPHQRVADNTTARGAPEQRRRDIDFQGHPEVKMLCRNNGTPAAEQIFRSPSQIGSLPAPRDGDDMASSFGSMLTSVISCVVDTAVPSATKFEAAANGGEKEQGETIRDCQHSRCLGFWCVYVI